MQTNTLDSAVHADWVLGALVGLQGLGPAGASGSEHVDFWKLS